MRELSLQNLAGAASRRLQCTQKSSGTSTTDHLGEAWLISLAADDTVGSRAAITVRSATIYACVLRKLAADFVADSFDFLSGMFVHRNFIGQGRTTDGKGANQDEGDGQISHGSLQLCASPPEALS